MRALMSVAVVGALAAALGGCVEGTIGGTIEPASEVSWTARDRALMSNLPYSQVSIPEADHRQIVAYRRKEAPGTILIDSDNKLLYYVLPGGKAIRYGIAVGEEAQAWSGIAKVGRKAEWPAWIPTAGEQARLGPFPAYVTGGPHNPMGARAMYLYSNGRDTGYRIHGTNQPKYIGQAVSSGCIRMTNENAIDLYNRVKVGTVVVVLPPHHNISLFSANSGFGFGGASEN